MTLDEALKWADRESGADDCSLILAAEVRRLQAELERLPARHAKPSVKAAPIGPTQWAKWGIPGMVDDTDEEFAERAGRKVTEVER